MISRFTVLAAAVCCAVTGSARIADGLVVYLNFDDNTDNGVPGPVSATVIGTGAGARFESGRFGRAAVFKGDAKSRSVTSDWAVALSPELERVYAGDWSLSFWIKDACFGDSVIIGNKNWTTGANTGWAVAPMGAIGDDNNAATAKHLGKVNWSAVDRTRHDFAFPRDRSFFGPEWRHVTLVCSRDADDMAVYLDGERMNADGIRRMGLAADDRNGLNAGLRTVVGAAHNGCFGAAATVDDVAIWSRALAPWEVRLLNARPAKIPEPAAYAVVSSAGVLAAVLVRRGRRRSR